MKKTVLFSLLLCCGLVTYAQLNLTFRSKLSYTGKSLANIWGYTDSIGREYALVGTSTGLSIVDVSNPATPVEKIAVVGTTNNWREVKTHGKYAYVTTEGGTNGLQIVNLSYLPDSVQVKYYKGNGAINNQINTIHALHIEAGFAYLYGSNVGNGGPIILNLDDPWNPNYVGMKAGSYVHDGYVRNDTIWAGHIYAGYFSAMLVSNKATPVILNTQSTPGVFTHNTWLSDDGSTLFTTDEIAGSYLTSYDVRNVNNIKELDRALSQNPGSNSAVHNTHIKNNYAVTSWYRDGVVIHDVNRPDNMILVGYYDTAPQSGSGFNGAWGVYPFFPSGNLVVSDIEQGLFVLTPNYIRGCYLEGIVKDTNTSAPINGVLVEILATNINKTSKITGVYKTGIAAAGSYSVRFSKVGYYPKTITGVNLANGVLTQLNVDLVPITTINIGGNVTGMVGGSAIAGASIKIFNSGITYNAQTDGAGNFSVTGFLPGSYEIVAGIWGYITYCDSNKVINGSSGPISIVLANGIYDDFTFDYGWTKTGTAVTGQWVRGVPIGTTFGTGYANPNVDVTSDCSTECYMTGNGGGGSGTDDVDDGNTILTSPVFNLSGYADPFVHYYRWFVNGGGSGSPNDTLHVYLDNGASKVMIERVLANSPGNASWVSKVYRVSDYLTPSATMKIIFETADWTAGGGHIVEAAADEFRVVDAPTGITNLSDQLNLRVHPNPFNSHLHIQYSLHTPLAPGAEIVIRDVTGRNVIQEKLSFTEGSLKLGDKLEAGIYFVELRNGLIKQVVKVIKTK
jgi:choice-of-anchor B domain-containing protein